VSSTVIVMECHRTSCYRFEDMTEEEDPFLWVGQTIDGKYEVQSQVGEGGFAVVYRCLHRGFNEICAVKALKIPRKLQGDTREKFLESFTAEGKLLHRLSRANASIVQALDVGAAISPNGTWTPYIVLEWLDGLTLEDDLRARKKDGLGGRTMAEALTMLEPAASALGTAHAQSIAHRDVKPANLFLATVGGKRALKVLDFGIAKVLSEPDLAHAFEATGASLQAFTPRYGAPEQFDRRFGATGPWTDVFALALIVVEVVSGKSALEGDTPQLFVASSNIQHRPTLRANGVDEGAAVEAVFSRALAVDPKERYASATAFWSALVHAATTGDTVLSKREAAASSTPNTVREGRPPVRVDVAKVPKIERETAPATAPLALPSRSRAKDVLFVVVALALGGLAYFARASKHDTTAKPVARQSPPVLPSAAPSTPPLPLDVAISSAGPGFNRYVNARYGFVLDVPEGVVPSAEQPNEAGRTFTGTDVEIRVVGDSLRGSGKTLDGLFEEASKPDKNPEGRWGSPIRESAGFFFDGRLGDKSLYEKTSTSGDRVVSLRILYAADSVLAPKLPHTEKSLSFVSEPGDR
jgi:serine/threonine protein kinase